MKTQPPDQELQKIVDKLELCALALRFYAVTKKPQYLNELNNHTHDLHQLVITIRKGLHD